MFRRLLIIPSLLALCGSGWGQSLKTYLALRKQYGIHQAVPVPALETLIGTRVMELQGTVKGTFQVGNRFSLLVERADRQCETVDSDAIPNWLQGGNEVAVRLLIKASRAGENAPLQATLIASAPEDEIGPIEREEQRKAQEEAARKAKEMQGEKGDPYLPFRHQKVPKDWNLPSSEVAPYYAAFIRHDNPRLSNAKAMEIANGIIGFSLRYGVDARLIMAMVMVESDFNPNETSNKGAMGLGQLMPSNVREMGVSNAYDTMENLSATVRLVRGHLNDYGATAGGISFRGLILALAAYNAGPGAV
ncbi:MAG TPA: transglycosylase SLT domain-containing protein, partial [Fimbriimonadaceae bacterium]|nr:transglycosylase SLT domain-containing protein [Fimbriimonadaceae bacterium]